MNKRKNKSIGDWISKISKDHFFAFEEEMTFFQGKDKVYHGNVCQGQKIYRNSFYKEAFKNVMLHYKLGFGGETFFKRVRCIRMIQHQIKKDDEVY